MKSIHFLGVLLISIMILTSCGNESAEEPSKDMGKDSLNMAKEVALRKEVSSRALSDRIADYQLLFSVQKQGKFNIHIMNGDGAELTELTDGDGNDLFPKWLVDGNRFVFESDRNQPFHTFLFSFADSLYKQLGNNRFKERAPYPSKDNEIVFISDRDKAQHIYRMNLEGGNLQKITGTSYNDAAPVWSPDALSLAFHTFRHDNQSDIYVSDRSGTNLNRITQNPGLDFTPDWSPDGKTLIFVSNRTGNFDIFSIKATGEGEPVNLTNTPDINEMMPTWSPDGTYIAYSVSNGPQSSIHVMTADGAISTQITPDNIAASMPSWRPPTELEKALEEDRPSSKQKIEVQIGN